MYYSDPLRLSRFLLEECRKRGVRLHQPAEATSVVTDEGGKMTGLKVKQSDDTETEGKISALHSTTQPWNLIHLHSAMHISPLRSRRLDTQSLPNPLPQLQAPHPNLSPSRPQHSNHLPQLDRNPRTTRLSRSLQHLILRLQSRTNVTYRRRNLHRRSK